LLGDFAQHLRAHVLELVGELDLLGDGDAVLGDARRAERLVEDDVAALGAQRHLHRIGEDVDAAQQPLARVAMKFYVLSWHVLSLSPGIGTGRVQATFLALLGLPSTMPMMSLSFMMMSSSPSSLTSVPDHLPNSTRSPALTSSGWSLPSSPRAPGPTAITSPSIGFSLAV